MTPRAQKPRRTASRIEELKTSSLQKLRTIPATLVRASGIFYLLFSVFALLFLTGCSMVSGTRHADGRLVVTSWRCMWKSEAIKFSVADSNLVATLTLGKSATDEKSVNAFTEAIVAGMVKGLGP